MPSTLPRILGRGRTARWQQLQSPCCFHRAPSGTGLPHGVVAPAAGGETGPARPQPEKNEGPRCHSSLRELEVDPTTTEIRTAEADRPTPTPTRSLSQVSAIAAYVGGFVCVLNFGDIPPGIWLTAVEIGEAVDLRHGRRRRQPLGGSERRRRAGVHLREARLQLPRASVEPGPALGIPPGLGLLPHLEPRSVPTRPRTGATIWRAISRSWPTRPASTSSWPSSTTGWVCNVLGAGVELEVDQDLVSLS